jgi:uncharacterized protein (TIGR02145 family)
MNRVLKLSLLYIAILLATNSYTQGVNFQGVARSANGTILASTNIGLRLSIISKNVDATPEYVETRTVATNAQGIFSVVVGDASSTAVIGNFKNIAWSDGIKFLKVEMDPAAGTNFINMGTTQLQYVPYAFYSLGVDATGVKGVLPVKAGGTGVSNLDSLKAALKITNIDTISLYNRINEKLSKLDTVNLSNRINSLGTKLNNQPSLLTTLNISQFERDKLNNINPGSVIWCTNCGSNGELQVFNGNSWKNLIGNDVLKAKPELDKTSISNITGHSVDVNSYILYSDDGVRNQLEGGFVWNLSPSPTISNSRYNQNFNLYGTNKVDSFLLSRNIKNLSKNTKYYIRSYGINQIGTTYGPENTFTTNSITSSPINPTNYLASFSLNEARFKVTIEDNGGEDILESGIEYSSTRNFSSKNRLNLKNIQDEYVINNLIPNQKYYIRSFAKNSVGETIQNDTSSFIAIDLSVEQNKTNVQIGNKIWSARNLNVSTYRNGDIIPLVTDSAVWSNLTTGAYTYYNNDSVNYGYLGKLYNWYAVNDSRGLAPTGWHIPTEDEVQQLSSYIGNNNAYKVINTTGNFYNPKFNETTINGVITQNPMPDNSTGLSILMGGGRQLFSSSLPDFLFLGSSQTFLWAKSNYTNQNTNRGHMSIGFNNVYFTPDWGGWFISAGLPVRIVKD